MLSLIYFKQKESFVKSGVEQEIESKIELSSFLSISISCSTPDFTKLSFCKQYIKDNIYDFKFDNIIDLLSKLKTDFNRRFTDFTIINNIIQLFNDPFNSENVPLQFKEIKVLRENPQYLSSFNSSKLLEFYKNLPNEFHQLKQNAFKITSFFPTNRCERLFSYRSH